MNEQALLTAWADEVVRLEDRVRDLESERDTYRELAQTALTHLHMQTELIAVQRRALNRLTREFEMTYGEERRATDHWLDAKLTAGRRAARDQHDGSAAA